MEGSVQGCERDLRKEIDSLGGEITRLSGGRVRLTIPFEGLELYADASSLELALEKLRRKLRE